MAWRFHIEHLGDARIAEIGAREHPLDVHVARSAPARAVGLLGTRRLGPHQALLLIPCGAVHAVGMRYALAVAFVDAAGRVLRVVDPLPRRGARCRGAHAVIEVASGGLAGVRVGDALRVAGECIFPLAPTSAA